MTLYFFFILLSIIPNEHLSKRIKMYFGFDNIDNTTLSFVVTLFFWKMNSRHFCFSGDFSGSSETGGQDSRIISSLKGCNEHYN